MLLESPLVRTLLCGTVLILFAQAAISADTGTARAADPLARSGWPRVPQKAHCTVFDRNTQNLQIWTVTEATECRQPADSGAGTPLLDHLQAVDGSNAQSNMFQIKFTCANASPERCSKVLAGFQQAGAIISSALAFRQPVIVDAQFRSFGPDRTSTLGSAATTRFHLMTDEDRVDRLYPQSLAKQLNPTPRNLADCDIFAEFNADVNFWFQGDGPIAANQHDFIYVILHELFHGLGFASSWRDYFDQGALTPLPQGNGQSRNFQEFAFDRFMVETKGGVPLENAARAISGNSRLRPDAESRRLFDLAQTSNSLAFVFPGGQDSVVLETSLQPYKPGSSISHAASSSSRNTPDFLMRFSLEPGITLQDVIAKCASGNPFGPIGPKLLTVMGALGYPIQSTPGSAIRDFLVMSTTSRSQASFPYRGPAWSLLGLPIVLSCFWWTL